MAFLESGGRALVLVGPPGSGKTTLLDELLARLPGELIRVANPLVSPITADRFLFQLGGQSDEGDDGEAITRHLLGTLGNDKPTTLAVDDAHTLDPQVWPVLAKLPGLATPDGPGMNLIIVMRPELLDALCGPTLDALQDPSRALIVTLPEPAHMRPPVMVVAPATTEIALAPNARPESPGRVAAVIPRGRSRLTWIGGAAVLALTVIALSAPVMRPPSQASVSAPASVPVHASAPASGPAPTTAVATPATTEDEITSFNAGQASVSAAFVHSDQSKPSAPLLTLPAQLVPGLAQLGPTISDNQLRLEFAAFLRRAGRDTANLSPSARDALYQEYLDWRKRGLSGRKRAGAN